MPDPARLTEWELREVSRPGYAVIERGTLRDGNLETVYDEPIPIHVAEQIEAWIEDAEARLAAAENVVEAARTVSDSPAGRRYGFLPLLNALAAYDAQKEKPRLSDLMRERYPDGLDAHKGKP